MPKLTRGLVLGAMLAVLSSATAAVAQPPDSWSEAVAQHRAGERASMDQPISDKATEQAMAQQRRWYYQSTHPLGAPGTPAASSEQPDQPVALIAALVAAAVLAQTLDALSIRRKARKAYPAT